MLAWPLIPAGGWWTPDTALQGVNIVILDFQKRAVAHKELIRLATTLIYCH